MGNFYSSPEIGSGQDRNYPKNPAGWHFHFALK